MNLKSKESWNNKMQKLQRAIIVIDLKLNENDLQVNKKNYRYNLEVNSSKISTKLKLTQISHNLSQ